MQIRRKFLIFPGVFFFIVSSFLSRPKLSEHGRFLPTYQTQADTVPKPLVSFVIPSTLSRDTLNRTIESLQRQSESNWEALIGVDVRLSKYNNLTLIEKRRLHFTQDPRLRWILIFTNSTDRAGGNGSGDVRNMIVRDHALADWVAFIDDDDTLTPAYMSFLLERVQESEVLEIYIFRMLSSRVIPPYSHGLVAAINNVGISFAVKKNLFVRDRNPISFSPSAQEDYYFLRNAQDLNVSIELSCNVTYFVRQLPKYVEPHKACQVGKPYLSNIAPKENLDSSGNWTESLLKWKQKQYPRES